MNIDNDVFAFKMYNYGMSSVYEKLGPKRDQAGFGCCGNELVKHVIEPTNCD
ncbi:hypothetical protein J41TS4_14530 [Paenibacillus apis]|uniref:Uncharacterized protein n=1 Tax=Paenibacillus apis TaxID=1792174 RepID=A0A920CJM4_9BACL|nr:hypothetical protein J41TS4_14530 [Paenibacillus apis]